MRHIQSCLLVALTCLTAVGQSRGRAVPPPAGCYDVVSLDWSPPDETIRLIPKRFELLNEPVGYGLSIFRVRSLPGSLGNPVEGMGKWIPEGNNFWFSWGMGLGGFRGTLKPTSADEFTGKLKEWCDFHCGWKKRIGKMRIRRTECAR